MKIFKLCDQKQAADGFLAKDGFRKVSQISMLEVALVGRHCYLSALKSVMSGCGHFVDLRSPSLWARLPTPVAAKAGPVPTHDLMKETGD